MSKRYLVKCVETGIVYESLKAACEDTGADNKTLRGAMEVSRRTAKGFHWEKTEKPKQVKTKKRGKKKKGKVANTYTGIYPPDKKGFEEIGEFYKNKYKVFSVSSGGNYFNIKICLIPPNRERKANFMVGIELLENGVRICKNTDGGKLKEHYPEVNKAFEKFIKNYYGNNMEEL